MPKGPDLNEFEVEFLTAMRDDKPLPFGGAAGNAVLDFLQDFGLVYWWADTGYVINEAGRKALEQWQN